MKTLRFLAIGLAIYLGVIVAFEGVVSFFGQRDARRAHGAGDAFVVLTTTDASGAARDTVVAAVEIDGQLYVAANHWPRAWYERALAHPAVGLTRAGQHSARRAAPVAGVELERVRAAYTLPLAIRVLTGFPPRRFLRLDPA